MVGPGVYPHAVFRAGQDLPTGAETELKRGDVVRVTAAEPHLAELRSAVGPVVQASNASDILTIPDPRLEPNLRPVSGIQ